MPGRVTGHAPVFDAARRGVVAGVGKAGDVAHRHDERQPFDAKVPVAQHAVGQVEAVAAQPFGVGPGTDRLDDDIGGQHGAVVEHDLVALEPGDRVSKVEPGAPFLVAGQQSGSQSFSERTGHREGQRVHDRHVGTEPVGGRGHLAPDEPSADDDQPDVGPLGEGGAQPVRVVERAEDVAVAGETVWAQARRHHEAVEAERRAVGEGQHAGVEVHCGSRGTEPPHGVGDAGAGPERHRSGRAVPARTSLDSGGRLYGMCGSAPTTTISAVQPAARNCSAARRPPRDAPTTTMRPSTSVLDPDRLQRTDVGGFLHGVTQGVVRVGHVAQLAVLVEVENLRRDEDALAVVLAHLEIDDDLHG